MNYGEYIKELRIKKGLYQKDLANALICSVQAISKYESGTIDIGIEYLDALCKTLKININDFYNQKDNSELFVEDNSFSQERFSKYIIYLRQKRGITQKELGELIDVPYKKISKWEIGVSLPTINELKALADFYNREIRELYYASEDVDYSSVKFRKKRKTNQ